MNSLCKLLKIYVKIVFDEACLEAFECLKEKLISAPINVSNREFSFEVMCDASYVVLGAVLG